MSLFHCRCSQRRRFLGSLAALLLCWSAGTMVGVAQIPVFSDTFENGSITNSSAVTGFWSGYIPSYCSIVESGGKLVMTAGSAASGNGVYSTNWYSAVPSDDFNFFKRPLKFEADISCNGNYSSLGFALTGSSTTSYSAEDSVSLSFSVYNTVSLGVKQDRPAAGASRFLVADAALAGKPSFFSLTLDATDYKLVVFYTGGAGVSTFSGAHNLVAAQWGIDGKSAIQFSATRASGGATGAGVTVTGTVDNFTVVSLAPASVFEDCFGNGAPVDSDVESGIWTFSLPQTSLIEEIAGALKQTATATSTSVNFINTTATTPVQSRFNFFDRQLKIGATVAVTGSSSAQWMERARLSLASSTGNSGSANDALVVAFRAQNNIALIAKTDASSVEPDNINNSANKFLLGNSEAIGIYSGEDMLNRFDLIVNKRRYLLTGYNPGKGSGIVRFSGEHGLQRSKWGSNGDSALMLETIRTTETASGATTVTTWDNLRVESNSERLLSEPCWTFTATYSTASYSGVASRMTTGSFRLWLPSSEPVIRGIVFIGPGDGEDYQYFAHDPFAQEAARSLGFGVIGYTYDGGRMNLDTGNFPAAIQGAVQAVLDRASVVSGRPEISNAPVCALGMSRGAFDSCYLARNWPERVITITPHCGGEWYDFTMTDAMREVPVLFVAGSVDGHGSTGPGPMQNDFTIWRSQGGKAAFVLDWNVGHTIRGNQGWEAMWVWISEVSRLRYPRPLVPSLTPGNPPTLQSISDSSAWLGERAEFSAVITPSLTQTYSAIAAAASFSGTATNASWLPSETAARAYRAMNSTDLVKRASIPTHSPVRIVSPAQFSEPVALGNSLNIEIDPRDFDNTNVLASVDFYDGEQWLGADSSGPAWSWSYTPSTTGMHSLSVVATDVLGNKRDAFRVIHVIPADFPPVARHYAYALATGLSQGGTLVASDPEGNAITNYSIVQPPSHGTLAVDPQSGAFTYQSTNGYSGTDHFAYTASDGTLSSAVATVSFSVVGSQVGNIDSISATPGASEGQIALTWSAAANAERYSIERSLNNSGVFYHIATVSAPLVSYMDSAPNLTQSYYYRAKAIYQGTESSYSAIASSLPNNPYGAVGLIGSITAAPGPKVGRITLTWSAATNATGYRIERADAPNSGVFVTTESIPAPTTFHTEMVGTAPELISFRVLPYNPAYTGTYSATASAIAYQPRTIETWVYNNFYTDTPIENVTGDLDIANSDRVTNLMRYALGYSVYNDDGDPLNLTPTDLPYVREQSISGANYLTCVLTRNKDADDITYRVQVSSDPAGPWSDIDPLNAANQVGVTDNTPTESQQIIVVKDTQPISAAAKRFMRVKVTRN